MKKSRQRPVPVCGSSAAWPVDQARPLFRDFMGLNETHMPDAPRAKLFRGVAGLARDYHSASSDLGHDSKFAGLGPVGRDGRDWARIYRDLAGAGWRVMISVMFERLKPGEWQDLAADTRAYAERFARVFAMQDGAAAIDALEIGNEPGTFSDDEYRVVVESTGRGFKAAAPAVRVATAAMTTGPSHEFYKSVGCLEGLNDCYDILTIHTYAELEGWPTWKRSFPEDARLDNYLTDIHRLCRWRDEHAPEKEIWITEFGYDAVDLPADKNDRWRHWQGSTDLQQAQWTVRSWLVFATLPVARAYYFFFNDLGEPKMHHASGMTRRFEPRPVFYASAHLQASLGDYRLGRIVLERPGEAIVLEFAHATDRTALVWVAWSPTGCDRAGEQELPAWPGTLERAEYMPVGIEPVAATIPRGSRRVVLTESPLYLFLRARNPKL